MTPRRSLLLGGFMGTGKTTVGRLVAARVGVPFLDLDEALVARSGRSIAALFAERGEPAFRALEAEALAGALSTDGPLVIALGGGSLLDRARRRDALGRACVVTLTGTPETLLARTAGGTRPLLTGAVDRRAAIEALLADRGDAYAEAHAQVTTDGRPPEAVAEAVLAAWSHRSIAVPMGARSYAVRFVQDEPAALGDAVAALRPSATFLVTDTLVAALWGERVQRALSAAGLPPRRTVVLAPGEEHKRLAAVEQVLTALVEGGADRDAVVIAHGGGVVTDLAGFAAATLLRGVRWVAAPTTLLAMVDASVGGKTGVDLGPAKNAVGAFHQPSAVVIDVHQVESELDRAYRSGLAEVVKTACIGDRDLFTTMEAEVPQILARDPSMVEELASRSVTVKAGIVVRDEREAGERAQLNFGHTLGHALEAEGAFSRWTHGEAVSLGMVAMLRVGVSLGRTDPSEAARVVALLERLGLPVTLDPASLRAALPYLSLDKKRRGGAIRAVLLDSIGAPALVPLAKEAFAGLLGLD